MKLAIAFLLGILVAEARWRRRIKRALADDARLDWPDGMCPNCVTPWKCNGPHLEFGGALSHFLPPEDDDGPPPADPYLDWLCIRTIPEARTSGSVTVDARDGGSNVWTS